MVAYQEEKPWKKVSITVGEGANTAKVLLTVTAELGEDTEDLQVFLGEMKFSAFGRTPVRGYIDLGFLVLFCFPWPMGGRILKIFTSAIEKPLFGKILVWAWL